MKKFHYTEIKKEKAEEGAVNTTVRWLIAKEMGAENFAMRLFEITSEGYSPYHKHPWEHEVFVLEGEGIARRENSEETISKGDVLFIPADEKHQLQCTGATLKFLCLIPYKR
ncbi:MAG: cupin domain-containing protein [Methanomicrobia archaeon]|nr:cupin domain-containing protein [Methanomicrobia archaeon]